jgi:MFS-type transporter involved in bile tolerance (Atg22 family)
MPRAFSRRDYHASGVVAAKTVTVVYCLIFLSFFLGFAEGDGAHASKGLSVAGWIFAVLGFPLRAVPPSIARAIERELPHAYYFVYFGAIAILWGIVAAILSLLWSQYAAKDGLRAPTPMA